MSEDMPFTFFQNLAAWLKQDLAVGDDFSKHQATLLLSDIATSKHNVHKQGNQ